MELLEARLEGVNEGGVWILLELTDDYLHQFLHVIEEGVGHYLDELVDQPRHTLHEPFQLGELKQDLLQMRPELDEDGLNRRRFGLLLLNVEGKARVEGFLHQVFAIDKQFRYECDVIVCVVVDVRVYLLLLNMLLHLLLLRPDPSDLLLVWLEQLPKNLLHVLGALFLVMRADSADQDS